MESLRSTTICAGPKFAGRVKGMVIKMQRKQDHRKNNATPYALVVLILAVLLAALFGMLREASGETDVTEIFLKQGDIRISGNGATVSGDTVTIGQGGHYRITGALEDGQIYVDSDDGKTVLLELSSVELDNSSEAAIHIERAEDTTILLASGTENRIRSGVESGGSESGGKDRAEKETEEQSGAAIYAEDGLLITGEGALYVSGQLNNGIQSKADLCIDGGNIEVNTVGNALKGKDSVTVNGGNFQIRAGKRGIQSKYELYITGGNIRIAESEEGLEANQVVIEGGVIEITAADDGINANGGEAKQKKKPSEDIVETMPNLIIRGGVLHIDAEGDGLDSNGNLLIEGGELTIDGPTKDDDGPLDYGKENDGVCKVKGGTVLAIGSSSMAETFDEHSEQCSFRYLFKDSYEAGSEIVIIDADGQELYRHTAAKTGASVVFSSPDVVQGETYTLRVGEQIVEIRQDSVSTGKSDK